MTVLRPPALVCLNSRRPDPITHNNGNDRHIMNKRSLPLVILLCAVFGGAIAKSGGGELHVYRWTDTAGVTHFSDKPPIGPVSSLKVLSLAPPPPASSASEEAATRAWIDEANRRAEAMIKADRAYRLEMAKTQAAAEARKAAESAQATDDNASVWGYPLEPFRYWIPHWRTQQPDHNRARRPPTNAARAAGAEDARQRAATQQPDNGEPSPRR